MTTNSFASKAQIAVGNSKVELYRLDALVKQKVGDVETLPYSLRILLENLLRYEDGKTVHPADIAGGRRLEPEAARRARGPAAPRARADAGLHRRPRACATSPRCATRSSSSACPATRSTRCAPVDLVIDHSVQVDEYGIAARVQAATSSSSTQRNRERYLFLRWGQQAFANMKVVPPGTGICHQVNLEYLAQRRVDARTASRSPTRSSAPTRTRR